MALGDSDEDVGFLDVLLEAIFFFGIFILRGKLNNPANFVGASHKVRRQPEVARMVVRGWDGQGWGMGSSQCRAGGMR